MENKEGTPAPETPKKEEKKDRIFLYLFILMTLSSITLGWLYWTQKNQVEVVVAENVQITSEAEILKRDLQKLQEDYAVLETNDQFLQAEIEEKRKLIEDLQKQVEAGNYDISKLKRETRTLRDIMKHYVKEIDSLNTLNKTLVYERDSVSTELSSERERRMALKGEKDKLFEIGSIIKATGMKVSALNVKGKNKEGETTKARRTDKIMVSFKLNENLIAPKGPRNIFVRIVTPDGKEWCDSPDAEHMFKFGESKGFYAMKRTINYDNQDLQVEMVLRRKDTRELQPGKYVVGVYMDHFQLGTTTLELE